MTDEPQAPTPEQPAEPERPEPAREAPQEAPTPAPKRGISAGAIIVLIVGIAVLLPLAFYYPEIKAFRDLQPWNHSGPREALTRFADALKANDVATIKGMLDQRSGIEVNEENGKIVSLKVGGALAPPTAVERVTPSGPAEDVRLKYSFQPPRANVTTEVPTLGGSTAQFMLIRQEGEWKVQGIAPLGGPGPSAPRPSAPGRGPTPPKGGPQTSDSRLQTADQRHRLSFRAQRGISPPSYQEEVPSYDRA